MNSVDGYGVRRADKQAMTASVAELRAGRDRYGIIPFLCKNFPAYADAQAVLHAGRTVYMYCRVIFHSSGTASALYALPANEEHAAGGLFDDQEEIEFFFIVPVRVVDMLAREMHFVTVRRIILRYQAEYRLHVPVRGYDL